MKGTCLCKSVTIESNDATEFEACHCGMCRRWGGGLFLARRESHNKPMFSS